MNAEATRPDPKRQGSSPIANARKKTKTGVRHHKPKKSKLPLATLRESDTFIRLVKHKKTAG